MKSRLFLLGLVLVGFSLVGGGTVAAASASEITTSILQKVSQSNNPRETLVQWYYSIADLSERLNTFSSGSIQSLRTNTVKNNLRQELNTQKSSVRNTTRSDIMLNEYGSYLDNAKNESLESLCKTNYEIADDWAYAFNFSTAVTLAVWNMESGCRLNNPNGDGIFQIIHNSYPAGKVLNASEIALQFYDFRDISRSKIDRHNNRGSVRNTGISCQNKNLTLTGVLAPVCLSYTDIDLDSVISYGYLYNGAYYRTGDLLDPIHPEYVFDYDNKDGLIKQVLQVLNYEKNTK